MGSFTGVGTVPFPAVKEMNPCRRALRDLMKELITSIPEVLLARDTPLLEAYNAAVDALAADDMAYKEMQDYMRLMQQQAAQKPIHVSPYPNNSPITPGITWTIPSSTTYGVNSITYGGG